MRCDTIRHLAVSLVLLLGAVGCDDGGGGGGGAGGADGGDRADAARPDGGGGGADVGPGRDTGPGGDDMGVACPPGTDGCPCAAGACEGELVCREGTCAPPVQQGLAIADAAARSCEVLFREGAGIAVLGATYDEGVEGFLIREAPSAALAFLRTADAPFEVGSVQLQLDGDAAALSIVRARCFDARGAELAGDGVTLP